MKTRFKFLVRPLMAVLVLWNTAACSGASPEEIAAILSGDSSQTLGADFGDAPDGLDANYGNGVTASFPSRLTSNGARHHDVTKVALGMVDDDGNWPNTAETDATDPLDADGVQNIDEEPGESDHDAKDDGLLTFVVNDDDTQSLQFSVTAASDAPAGTYYVNVLFDWNKDGKWEGVDANGADEWAVKNHEVALNPGDSFVDRTEEFLTGVTAHPVWVRITLSDTPIDGAEWTGTGEFLLGETEDYILRNEQVISLEANKLVLPGVPLGPLGPKPLPPIGGGGGSGDPASCDEEFFMSTTICKGKSVTKLLTIGGFAPDSIEAVSGNPGTASVSLNESNVTITGNAVGTTTVYVTATQGGCTYYLTISVTVKDCPKARRVMIDCCSQEEIRRDPSLCKNCHVVGRQHNQSNTHGGGGEIPETDMEGEKTNISKSYVIARDGGLIDVVTVYYDCDPCDEEEDFFLDEDDFFAQIEDETFGGENEVIDDWYEYYELQAFYDALYDEATYECAMRYFEDLYSGFYSEESISEGGGY